MTFISVFNRTFDLVFLVDGTRGVTDENFRSGLRFARNLAKVFNRGITRTGLVIYAEEPETVIDLTDQLSLTEANISSVKYLNQIKRNTGYALNYTKVSVFDKGGRSGIPKVLVVLEGDSSSDGIDEISQVYSTSGFHVFGVGNGNQLAQGQLKEISSRPSSHYYSAIGYSALHLDSFVQTMRVSIATGENKDYR